MTATISDSAAQTTVICSSRLSATATPARVALPITSADIQTRRKTITPIVRTITTTGMTEFSLSLPGKISGGLTKNPMSAKTPTDTQHAKTIIEAILKRSPMDF
jgi:hypothetical protein